MNGMLSPEEQLKVLARVWGYDRTGFVFLPHIDGQAKDKDARRKGFHENRAFRWPRDKEAIVEHLKAKAGDDLYFTPALFKGKRRITQHLLPERSLWADLDPVNPEGLGEYRPTIAWESSPGRYQGIWLLNEPREGASKGGRENHRLTAYINADPSGWDSTQLLRVPGRMNFKPEYTGQDEPNGVKGRGLLWDAGPRYVWSDFEELPEVGSQVIDEVELVDEDVIDRVDRHEVWGRLRLKVSRKVREYMALKTEPPAGNRNEVLWQIERELADAGASLVEIVAIVRASAWNKYRGRHDEMKRLKIEAAKALAAREESPAVVELDEDAPKPSMNWLSDVVQQPIPRPRWLVRNMWTRGGCGFISGAPKSYKSWMALDMAVTVATGTTFLGQPAYKVGRPEPVLYLQEEDDLLLVMQRLALITEAKVPDLYWHGQMSLDDDGQVVWEGPHDTIPMALHVQTGFIASDPGWQAWLDEAVEENGFSMVIIDTLSTTAGDIDTDRSSELMTQMLKPLKVIAKKNDAAIVVVHHNKKSATDARGSRAGNDMLGSVALHAWVDCAIYARAKDSSGIQIERESKMAQDESLRINVPFMFEDMGTGSRQLWQPELALSDVGQEQPAEGPKKPSGGNAGAKIANKVKQLGPGPHSIDHIAHTLDMSAASVKKQLAAAVENGLLYEVDGGYTSRMPS